MGFVTDEWVPVQSGSVRSDSIRSKTSRNTDPLFIQCMRWSRDLIVSPLTSYHTLNLSYKESLPIPIWQPTYFGINPRRHNALSFHASPYSHIYIWALVRRWMITSNTKYINERVTYLLKNGVLVGIKPI